MKNKFITLLFVVILNLNPLNLTFADEFIFEVGNLEITNNGKVYSTFDDGLTWTKTEIPEELSRGRYVYSMACG